MSDLPLMLCIPGAGASSAKFDRMRSRLAPAVQVRTFELPGRGIRYNEPSFTNMRSHITHFVDGIEREPYKRWIVLGESLGSLTSMAVINQLLDSPRAEILGFIAASASPKVTGTRSNEEVLASLKAESANAEIGEAAFEELSKTVVADLTAARAAEKALWPRPIDIPIAILRGEDDGLIDEQAARAWQDFTTDRSRYRSLPGDHYQFDTPTDELLAGIFEAVDFITGAG